MTENRSPWENKGFFLFAFDSVHVKYGVRTWPNTFEPSLPPPPPQGGGEDSIALYYVPIIFSHIFFKRNLFNTDPVLYGQPTLNLAPREPIHSKRNLLTARSDHRADDSLWMWYNFRSMVKQTALKTEGKHHNMLPKMIKEKKGKLKCLRN